MSQNITWFHGTRTEGITTFHPMTHIGDRYTARMTCANKKNIDGHDGKPQLIEVALSLNPSEILEFNDVGSPTGIAFAYFLLCDKEKLNLPDDLVADLTVVWKQEKSKKSKMTLGTYGEKEKLQAKIEVAQVLINHGYKAYSYKNVVESKSYESSLCIFDPTVISIVKIIDVSEEDSKSLWDKSKRNL